MSMFSSYNSNQVRLGKYWFFKGFASASGMYQVNKLTCVGLLSGIFFIQLIIQFFCLYFENNRKWLKYDEY